jgi:beta-lactam-binding protein with PASTA domain
MKIVARVLWVFPFILFFCGYYIISLFIRSETIKTPSLTGKRLQEVVALLTPYQLNIRILGEVEDATLPEGTVITQRPQAGQKIKFYQSVGVVISHHPPASIAPNLVGLSIKDSSAKADKERLRLKVYWLESAIPKDQCIAQYPAAGLPLVERLLFAYFSKGQTTLRIVPNLTNLPLPEVRDFLKNQGVAVTIWPAEIQDFSIYRITAQKPNAGSFIDLSERPHVQLYVQKDTALI